MNKSYTLQPDDLIGDYEIIKVLGSGGFGVTYHAMSYPNYIEVAIKEYFPTIAIRGEGNFVQANSRANIEEYEIGLNRFLSESEILQRFYHVNIVKIFTTFEANGTAYMVMEYEHGKDLGQYMDAVNRPLSYTEIIQYFIPILDGLRAVHNQNILHLDIKPDNILIRTNSTPCLIDFGGARHYAYQESRLVTDKVSFMVAADGYSPPEQYSEDKMSKGPWSDIYSMGATIYSCMNSGDIPPNSTERSDQILNDRKDPLQPAIERFKNKYPNDLLELVDQCLCPQRINRPQNATEMQDILIRIANKEAINWENKKPILLKKVQKEETHSSKVEEGMENNVNQDYKPDGNSNKCYAGFWARAAALLLDLVIIFSVFFILGMLIGLAGLDEITKPSEQLSAIDAIAILLQWVYFAGMESSKTGGTFGKMAVRIRVVDLDYNKVSFARATVRYFGKILSSLILFIGFFMTGFTRKKQGLHDMIAGTIVIQKG